MSNAISKPNKRNRSKTNDASDKRNETETESKVQLFSLAGSVVKDHNLTQDRLKIDPDLEKLIPRPSVEEFQALSISIERDGQLQDIIVDDQGTVVDGHSRFRILKDLGRPIKFEVRSFLTKEAERVFIIKSSLLRRNINDFQKIVLAQPLIAIEKVRRVGKTKSRDKTGDLRFK